MGRVMDKLDVQLRWMIKRDLDAVLAIEEASFIVPWSEEDFLESLRQRNVIGTVACAGETIVGYTLHEIHKKNLHILNLAVAKEFRRMGVGRLLVQNLLSKLSEGRRPMLTAAVAERNWRASS